MLIVIKIKDTDDIIGAKEAVAARIEDVADIQRIDVYSDEWSVQNNEQKR